MSIVKVVRRIWQSLVDLVRKSLEQLPERSGPVVLNFWAPQGGGKTSFLDLLRRTTWIGTTSDIVPLGPWDARAMPSSQLTHEILAAIDKASSKKKKLMLLVDNLDWLLKTDSGRPFFQFEEKVARQVIERQDTVLVVTSRSPLIQWREYDVRVEQKSVHIPPLTEEEVTEWAKDHNMDPKRAFYLSMGYPQVLAWLEETPDLPEEALDRRIESYFKEDLSEEAGKVAQIASAFLLFDPEVLRMVDTALGSFISSDEEDLYGECADLIRELIAAGLAFWDGSVGAYRFRDSVVRGLLARSFRHRRHADFQKLHDIAADYYTAEARHAGYLHRVLVSAVYHLAYARGPEGPEEAIRWVESTLALWTFAPWEHVLHAWRSGMGDDYILKEMQELLGLSAWNQITRLLESADLAAKKMEEEVKS